MIRSSLFVTAGLALLLTGPLPAQSKSPKEKSPADLAAEAFFKLRDDKDATLSGARIVQLQQVGLDFLTANPGHARAGSVISALANFGSTIRDKKLLPMRDYWSTQLNYEILSRRTKAGTTDEAKAALGALDATHAGYLVRTTNSRENLDNFRAKIDRLAELEGGARYLPTQERDYLQVLLMTSGKLGEAHARKLLESPDKKIAAVAREELNLFELGRTPLELKAPLLNGKEFDAAALRGKVVYFIFWSAAHEASVKELAPLLDYYKPYQKLGVEIVTVAHDTDAAELAKFVKAKGYPWPVIFDGQGNKGAFSEKVNARSLPASALFNQQGTLVRIGLKTSQLEAEVMKLGIKRR